MRLIIIALLTLVLLISCISLNELAPPVSSFGVVGYSSSKLTSMERGRKLYIGKCAKCHSVEPVKKYPAGEWTYIIKDMAKKTKLNKSETLDLKNYIWGVLENKNNVAP